MSTSRFDDIRPYTDSEVKEAMQRVAANPLMDTVANFLFPKLPAGKLREMIGKIETTYEFQTTIMYMAMKSILESSTEGCTSSGLENLKKDGAYIFLANHRDIILDSGIMQFILYEAGFDSSEMSFGSNLMMNELVIDIGKSNKMYKTIRATNKKELVENSKHLSDYLRYTISEKKASTWIAHRNGRTKNGDDKTEPGLLRMLSMTGPKNFISNLLELNLTPVSTSYEYETCTAQKVQEVYLSSKGPYIKKPGEDLNSIISGISEYKGGMHIAFCKTIDREMLEEADTYPRNEKYAHLAKLIDREIYLNYKLWKNNYIAYDILVGGNEFSEKYDKADVEKFKEYQNKTLSKVVGPEDIINTLFLKLYANPVINRKNVE
jgi:hypothetical protein